MKTLLRLSPILLGLAALASGCVSGTSMSRADLALECAIPAGGAEHLASPASPAPAAAPRKRMLVWRASLSIEVANVDDAVAQALAIAEQHGGYLERKSGDAVADASLSLRIPATAFAPSVGSLEKLGSVTYRYVSNSDVTEEYVDADARLKNKTVLRDRLRKLLDKATEVKDVLAIETELNRVQGEIDSMEARLKSLKGQVDFATLDLNFHRKKILGPLGYALHGLWWTLEKMFVIRQ